LAPCDIPAIIGHNIRSWREFNGYPLKYLAAEIGMSVAICSQWENGRRYPSAVHLARLARIVNCRPSCLLCENFPQRLSGWQAGLTHRETAVCRPGSKVFHAIVARHGKKVGEKMDGTLAGRRGVGSVGERG
jgi:transcriptional regulator with XRE-family HTH domain